MRYTSLIAIGVAAACGGSDGPSNNAGVVQVVSMTSNALLINCSDDNVPPPNTQNIGAPDTAIFLVKMVNTTENDVQVSSIGTFGVVVTATDPADVGKSIAVIQTLTFAPSPAVLVARTGDLDIRVSVPMHGICRSKPVGYVGDQDLNISIRVTTPVGQFVTTPATMRFNWRA